jgi:hypothetical protein
MIQTERYNTQFRKELATSLPKPDNMSKTGSIVGENLYKAEENYLKAIESGDYKSIQKNEISYQKAMRVFQTFSQLMRNSYQLFSEVIRNISFR